ncbi:MAG: sensor histidine kinase [Candidatus Acidiferrales bacterium]
MKMKRPSSIAARLTRMNMLVSALALLLACAGFVAYDVAAFRQSIVTNLSTQARVAGSSVIAALTFDDPQTGERALAPFKAAPHIISARIYTANGKAFASYQRDTTPRIPGTPEIGSSEEEAVSFTDKNVTLTRQILFDGRLVGYIFIESDLLSLIDRVRSYGEIAGGVLALSLLLALFVSRLARRTIAVPIARLADAARVVSREKDYSVRAVVDAEDSELTLLTTTFNEMLAQIEARDHILQNAHDELEQRVLERTAALEAANKELESFSYSVSHDLRAPLRSIDGFSLALEEDYGKKLDSAAKSHIRRVRAATQRMGVLIDDLLNLSRLSRLEMEPEDIDLSTMARAIASELARMDEGRRVEWVIRDSLRAHGDARLLRVVLDNLLGNAWKYSSRHENARIEFGVQRQCDSMVFFVKDDGAGFDSAYSEKLFGAFQRLHGATEFPGTGVGLATVQRIIRRHGGSVWAESAVEKGATFYFTLSAASGETNGNTTYSADRRQPGRRSADVACVAKEQYQE